MIVSDEDSTGLSNKRNVVFLEEKELVRKDQ